MTNTETLTPELREAVLLLARTARAIRADKFDRALELIFKAQDLLDKMPGSEAALRGCKLVETLAQVGIERAALLTPRYSPADHLSYDAEGIRWEDTSRPCPECGVGLYDEPCVGCGV